MQTKDSGLTAAQETGVRCGLEVEALNLGLNSICPERELCPRACLLQSPRRDGKRVGISLGRTDDFCMQKCVSQSHTAVSAPGQQKSVASLGRRLCFMRNPPLPTQLLSQLLTILKPPRKKEASRSRRGWQAPKPQIASSFV